MGMPCNWVSLTDCLGGWSRFSAQAIAATGRLSFAERTACSTTMEVV